MGVLTGKFSDQKIIKSGCTHTFEREEAFTTLQLDVRNCDNLYESLEQSGKGDLLEGDNAYMCPTVRRPQFCCFFECLLTVVFMVSQCNVKRDTIKRMNIKVPPPVLCVHEKRFDYDWERV
jgi:ubiquitin C-terminal hydrolase